jgi:hypothetical protein
MFYTLNSNVSNALYSTYICLPSRFSTTTVIHCCEDTFIRNYDSSSEIIVDSLNLDKYIIQIIVYLNILIGMKKLDGVLM